MTQQAMKATAADFSGESQRELAEGVLKQAAQDLRWFHGATSKVERELYNDAYSWVMSEDYFWPFSFLNVCRLLNRAPEDLQQELIGDFTFGPFGRWAHRRSRASRRFLDSLIELFATDYNPAPALPARLVQTWH